MIMLNSKETMLLQDEKKGEELCVQKYKEYSSRASDQTLKDLFSNISNEEQQHLDSINQILSGSLPTMNSQQGQQTQQSQQTQPAASTSSSSGSSCDKMLCEDSLATEKYISSSYNTGIFEFRDPNVRQILNHIQKEEQGHGEQIYNYMNQHGMYN